MAAQVDKKPNLRLVGKNYPAGEKPKGEIIAEYIYQDKDGNDYSKIERWEHITPKTGRKVKAFPQFYAEKGVPGQTADSFKRGRPKYKIPYKLPQLLAADPEEPVFICEGEKDADTLYDEYDLVSTTASEGAIKGAWANYAKELNKWFKGKQTVYIMQDNDVDGERHAIEVANSLMEVVPNVFIIEFSELQIGSDVTDWHMLAKGSKEDRLAMLMEKVKKAIRYEPVPIIDLKSDKYADPIEAVLKHLRESKHPVLMRAGKMVEPIWTAFPSGVMGEDNKPIRIKTTAFEAINAIDLRLIVDKHVCRFRKFDPKLDDWVFTKPPLEVMEGCVSHSHTGLPTVAGATNAPTMRPDGTIILEHGYDEQTSIWHQRDPDLKMHDVPKKPTKKDAEKALAVIKDLFKETSFKAPLDLSVCLAALLTAVGRGAFDMAPMFLFRAHESGSGKSYIVDIISHIVTGRWCPVTSLVGSREERDKRIGALLLEGPPLMSLDNLEGSISDILLVQMVERPTVKVRILGESEAPVCEWRGTLFGTGNNAHFAGDMVRRGLTCTIDAGIENPANRKFKSNPLKMVMADRGKYIAAALTIMRAYFISNAKVKATPFGSYERWNRFIRLPLIWLGEPDPIESQKEAVHEDPFRIDAARLMEQWNEHIQERQIKASELIAIASETIRGGGDNLSDVMARPELFEVLVNQAGNDRGSAIDPKRLGWYLRRLMGQVHAGCRIVLANKDDHHGHKWKIERAAKGLGQK